MLLGAWSSLDLMSRCLLCLFWINTTEQTLLWYNSYMLLTEAQNIKSLPLVIQVTQMEFIRPLQLSEFFLLHSLLLLFWSLQKRCYFVRTGDFPSQYCDLFEVISIHWDFLTGLQPVFICQQKYNSGLRIQNEWSHYNKRQPVYFVAAFLTSQQNVPPCFRKIRQSRPQLSFHPTKTERWHKAF